MFLDMQGEVVGACKGPLAHPAGVRPHPRVLPHVPPQLVRPRELPATALPGAHVRLLPSVSSQMRLHMTRLVVGLATGGVGALVEHWGLPEVAPLPPHQQGGGDSVDLGRAGQGAAGQPAVVLRQGSGLLLMVLVVVLFVRVYRVRLYKPSKICLALVACGILVGLVWVVPVQVQDMVWASLSLRLDGLVVGVALVGLVRLPIT